MSSSSPSRRRLHLPLGTRIFLVTAAGIGLAVGAAVLVTSVLGNEIARKGVNEALAGANSVQNFIRERRYEQLTAISDLFVSDANIAAYVAEASAPDAPVDTVSLLDLLAGRQNQLGFDFALLLDPRGRMLVRTDQPGSPPADLSQHPIVARLLRDFTASGVWAESGRLFYSVGVAIQRGPELIGFLVTGFAINDVTALEVKRISGSEVAFIAGGREPELLATTLDQGLATRLLAALRSAGDPLGRVIQRSETVDALRLDLGGDAWVALLSPLKGAEGEPVGASVALASLDRELATYRRIQTVLVVVGLLAMALALALSFLLSRRTLAPLRQLARAADAAAAGDYDQKLPAGGSDEVGQTARAFDKLLRELREKRDMEVYVGELARTMPDSAGGGQLATPELAQLALLAIELRRYAHPSVQSDPEATAERLAQDLRRVTQAVQGRRGEIEAVLGHRILCSFAGEGRAFRALGACAEVLPQLGRAESAFEEVIPPAAAVVVGQAVAGSLVWGGGPHRALVGLPVQQLENLLREATPGDILLSDKVYAELGNAFRQAGFELSPQRGLVSSQKIFQLTPDVAAAVTGVTVSPAAAAGATGATVSVGSEAATLAGVSPGALLGERFEILSVLGAGGMGVVYKARDRELDDLVALKMLKREVSGDRELIERLKNELKLARRITHPNVLRTFDFGEVGGIPFISMEYVRGVTLRFLLDQTGRLPLTAGLRVAKQLCAGLGAAHQVGVIHRDIKPENMIIEPSGNAKLMDFGIARPVQRVAPGQTQAGFIVGTPHYLAPEQLEGKEPDQRADIYACGVVLFELFTGSLPFSGDNPMQVILKHLNEEPPRPSAVWSQMPGELEQIILRCLTKDRGKRFANADQLGSAIAALRT
jgi:HAMP domain-containing protein